MSLNTLRIYCSENYQFGFIHQRIYLCYIQFKNHLKHQGANNHIRISHHNASNMYSEKKNKIKKINKNGVVALNQNERNFTRKICRKYKFSRETGSCVRNMTVQLDREEQKQREREKERDSSLGQPRSDKSSMTHFAKF